MNNESDLNKAVALEFGMKPKDADAMVDFIQAWIVNTTLRDGEAKLHGYGKFVLVERPDRVGRNPKTGEAIQIAASKSMKFKPFKQSLDLLNAE